MVDAGLDEVLVGGLGVREEVLGSPASERPAVGARKKKVEVARDGRFKNRGAEAYEAAPRGGVKSLRPHAAEIEVTVGGRCRAAESHLQHRSRRRRFPRSSCGRFAKREHWK